MKVTMVAAGATVFVLLQQLIGATLTTTVLRFRFPVSRKGFAFRGVPSGFALPFPIFLELADPSKGRAVPCVGCPEPPSFTLLPSLKPFRMSSLVARLRARAWVTLSILVVLSDPSFAALYHEADGPRSYREGEE